MLTAVVVVSVLWCFSTEGFELQLCEQQAAQPEHFVTLDSGPCVTAAQNAGKTRISAFHHRRDRIHSDCSLQCRGTHCVRSVQHRCYSD